MLYGAARRFRETGGDVLEEEDEKLVPLTVLIRPRHDGSRRGYQVVGWCWGPAWGWVWCGLQAAWEGGGGEFSLQPSRFRLALLSS